MKRKTLLYLALMFLIGIFVGYSLKKTPVIIQEEKAPVSVPKIPECIAYRCPEYSEFTVDKSLQGDTSVIIVPTAMTQGAGKLMIIKDGKVIFESPELPGIGVKQVDDGDGFILTYNSPRDENLEAEHYEVRYVWRDGKFIEK